MRVERLNINYLRYTPRRRAFDVDASLVLHIFTAGAPDAIDVCSFTTDTVTRFYLDRDFVAKQLERNNEIYEWRYISQELIPTVLSIYDE